MSVDETLASNSVQFLGVIIVLNCGGEGSLVPGGTGGNDQAGIWMSGRLSVVPPEEHRGVERDREQP